MTKGTSSSLPPALFLPFLLLLASCNSNILYTESHAMTDMRWALEDTPVFAYNAEDTVNSCNMIFNIRTGSSYPFRNIWLFVTATSPDGKTLTDTLQYYLADEKGKWYGKGLGDIHELDLPFKSNIFFPKKGTYQFRIRHGMRVQDLKGVYDFGLRVEKIGK